MKIYRWIILAAILLAGWWLLRPHPPARSRVVAWFAAAAKDYRQSAGDLAKSVSQITDDSASWDAARRSLVSCRLMYKRISFFLEFYFPEQARVCNGPPVPEIEEGMNEYRDPSGMQVIEAFLYSEHPARYRNEMLLQAQLLQRSVDNILPFLDDFIVGESDLWYGISLELIRIYTLYITGYDAPQLKSGIAEASVSLGSLDSIIAIVYPAYPFRDTLRAARQCLSDNKDFDRFKRLLFITEFAQPLQASVNAMVGSRAGKENPAALNFLSRSLFGAGALSINNGSLTGRDSALALLGKMLFSDNRLSGANHRSCSNCHSPTLFFSDRLRRNRNRENTGDLLRNTPSLLYAGFQSRQFWDGRVATLEEQAKTVMNDTLEMKGPGDEVSKKLQSNPEYVARFAAVFPAQPAITEEHIAAALAAYVRSLKPFKSPFDAYLAGDRRALTASQIRGFDIFMGKALCGTCHFAPVFNGLLPPLYRSTEFEILGVPANDQFTTPQADTDTGRARSMTFLSHGAFKTPTVRNTAETGPYMHNGSLGSLEAVIDFYDRGGGQGLGLETDGQTLSDRPLHLTDQEKNELVQFIRALTDK